MKISGRDLLSAGLSAASILLVSFSADSAQPAAPVPAGGQPTLASHRALYSVTMTNARPGGEYLDVSGKMVLQFADACDGWTTTQKSMLRSVMADGTEQLSNSDFSSWESKAGDSYRFAVKQTDGNDVTEFRGKAKRTGTAGPGTAEYTKPDRKTYALPPRFFFQTAQQRRLIELADKGERFFNGQMFDGSEGGGAAQFNAVVLKASKAASSPLKSPLLDGASHRVRVAFYPPAGVSTDGGGRPAADTGEQPEYEMTMTVYDNGVVSDYDYDYDEFSVHGRLERIEAVSKPPC